MKYRPGLERWEEKIERSGDCWTWTARVDDDGYPVFRAAGGRTVMAHRWGYEQFVGPIPEGLTLDHLCHTHNPSECLATGVCLHRRCVNPQHLEPVTLQENISRSHRPPMTVCRRGHEYTPENTRIMPSGVRMCRTCQRAYDRLARKKRKEKRSEDA